MRKMKNYLKIGILLLGLILIMTNCETENEVMENPITIEKEFIIKQYHFKDLSSNFTFQKAIEKLNSKKSKSIYSNKSTDDIYNFTIDSTRIKEVIKGNYTSYTLLINRPFNTSEYFENLVIEIKENETINAFIIKYILSSPIKIFEEHNSFSFQANFTIVPLDINNINLSSKSTSNSCSQIAQTWCSWDYPHIAGQSCYLANDNRLFTVLIDDPDCPENGYPSYGGGGGGGTTGSDPDPIYTSPINPDGTPIKFPVIPSANLINNLESLNDAQIAWINGDVNEESVRIIDSFLNDNNSSPEAKDFALLAIDTYIDKSDFNLNDFDEFNQYIPNYKARMTQQELMVFNNISKKFQTRYLYNANKAQNKAIELFPGMQRNTKADAFRHSYFHSLNTYFIGENLSIQLGDAHEIETPDSLILEKVMDLFNNQVGREKAKNPAIYFNAYDTLIVRIFDAVKNGNLEYLTPLNSDGTINSSTQLIPTNQ